jgi:predicted alpha-1,6-mannanase (GH76 family)
MFQLGARLAKYTGNKTYADWAERSYDWLAKSPMLPGDGQIYDGTDVLKECIDPERTPWTYNYGIMIGGAAYVRSSSPFPMPPSPHHVSSLSSLINIH